MKMFLYFSLLMSVVVLYGCGNQVALSGKAYDDYQKALKPYAYYWQKPQMTVESRRLDSWDCGTAPTLHAAEHVVFSNEVILSEQRKGERDYQLARERLRMKWVECMKDKGYVWVKEQ